MQGCAAAQYDRQQFTRGHRYRTQCECQQDGNQQRSA
jgi:hypothetical protein